MKNSFAYRLAGAAIATMGLSGAALPSAGLAADMPGIVSMLSSPVGSTSYIETSAIATVIAKNAPFKVEVIPINGSNALVELVGKGERDFASVTSINSNMAYHGVKPFKQEFKDIRLVVQGNVRTLGITVRKDADIKSVKDLKGMRVSGAYTGHPVCANAATAFLSNVGLTWNDVRVVPVSHAVNGVQALMEGRVDAAMCVEGDMGVLKEAHSKVGVKWISPDISADAVKRATDMIPLMSIRTIKGGEVTGVEADMPLWTYQGGIIASAKTPPAVVEAFLAGLWGQQAELAKMHPSFTAWTADLMLDPKLPVPFHDGAIAFLKKRNAWSPALDKSQSAAQ
jgi:TRAP transporter TAXI family solute receptor